MRTVNRSNQSLFLLNLKCSNAEDIIDQISKYIANLHFEKKIPQIGDIRISKDESLSTRNKNGTRGIYLAICQQKDYKKYIEFAENIDRNVYPNQVPILMGNRSIVENVVWNLNVKEEDIINAEIGVSEELSKLRQLILYNLSSIMNDDLESWVWINRDYKKRRKRIKNEYKAWLKMWTQWAKKSHFERIPEEYFYYASWICIALYGKLKDVKTKERSKDQNKRPPYKDFTWLKERLKEIQKERETYSDKCHSFFKEILENVNSYSREAPGPSELQEATAPFVKRFFARLNEKSLAIESPYGNIETETPKERRNSS